MRRALIGNPQFPSPGCSCHGGLRTGLTLVEVLTVLGILSILFALTAAGIQSARATARRVQCQANLHQWGLAYNQYHDVYGVLPEHYLSLLPMLGTTFSTPRPDYRIRVAVAECPADEWINRQNAHIPIPMGPVLGQLSYRSNQTVYFRSSVATGDRNPQASGGTIHRWRDVTDGLSQTALCAEKIVYFVDARSVTPNAPLRSPWFMNPRLAVPYLRGPELQQACEKTASRPALGGLFAITEFEMSRAESTYGHDYVPNSRSCLDQAVVTDEVRVKLPHAATSQHSGGVNALACDGSVRFVSESVSPEVWWAFGTMDADDQESSAQ